MYILIVMSNTKRSMTSGYDLAVKRISIHHGKRERKQTFEKRIVKLMSQETPPVQQRTCNHSESSVFSSHLKRELTIIIQLTTGDPITLI